MQIPKPSEQHTRAFADAVASLHGAVVKPMFGNLGAFVNGNMFGGLFGPDLGVRLLEASDADRLATLPGSGPFGPAERPMGGYLSLPADWPDHPELVAEWLGLAFNQVSSLPPKAAKSRT